MVDYERAHKAHNEAIENYNDECPDCAQKDIYIRNKVLDLKLQREKYEKQLAEKDIKYQVLFDDYDELQTAINSLITNHKIQIKELLK